MAPSDCAMLTPALVKSRANPVVKSAFAEQIRTMGLAGNLVSQVNGPDVFSTDSFTIVIGLYGQWNELF